MKRNHRSSLSKRIAYRQDGAVLLMLLVMVTVLGLMAGIAGSSWKTIVQRAKEQDLLWKGNQIQQAIGRYYNASQTNGATIKKYPPELADLLLDQRFLEPARYLRRPYTDPMTGEPWILISAPGGGIMGVRSSSLDVPFKQDGFSERNKDFVGRQSYEEWEFVYRPLKPAQGNLPSVKTKPSQLNQ